MPCAAWDAAVLVRTAGLHRRPGGLDQDRLEVLAAFAWFAMFAFRLAVVRASFIVPSFR
jgi:hypothetical protein